MNHTLEKINNSAYLYQQSVLSQFEDICNPLFQLGIKYFDYLKIFDNGYYLRLINNLKYSKEYLTKIKDNGLFFTNQINEIQENKCYYTFLDDIKKFDKRKDPILHLLYDFNMWNSLLIYKKNNKNFIECYVFQMAREDTEFSQFYLNNLTILEHFCDYFNDRARELINCSDKSKLACYDQQFNFSTSKEGLLSQKIEQFLQETGIKKENLKIKGENLSLSKREIEGFSHPVLEKSIKKISNALECPPSLIKYSLQDIEQNQGSSTGFSLREDYLQLPLSPREKECLFLLTRGKTAKHIAKILEISHRTVESHILHIKSKLGCHTKDQIIDKAFESGFVDFRLNSLTMSLENKQENINESYLRKN